MWCSFIQIRHLHCVMIYARSYAYGISMHISHPDTQNAMRKFMMKTKFLQRKKQITTQKFRLHSQSYVALWGSSLNSGLCGICM